MAFSICYWTNYTQGKTKLSRKSENAVTDDRVLKFLYDADLRHVESSVRCHRKYKNGRIKVDLGEIIFIYLHAHMYGYRNRDSVKYITYWIDLYLVLAVWKPTDRVTSGQKPTEKIYTDWLISGC